MELIFKLFPTKDPWPSSNIAFSTEDQLLHLSPLFSSTEILSFDYISCFGPLKYELFDGTPDKILQPKEVYI